MWCNLTIRQYRAIWQSGNQAIQVARGSWLRGTAPRIRHDAKWTEIDAKTSIRKHAKAATYSPIFYLAFFYLARERISKSTQPNPLFRNSLFRNSFFRGMNRNRSVSIRNITTHFINDKNTSIAGTCIVFNGKSAGNNPRLIYWSYEFLFFRPLGLRTRRPAGEDPDVKIRRSKGLTPWFYVVFYGDFDERH